MSAELRLNRREVLQRAAWLVGGVVAAPTVLGVLNGCSSSGEAGAPLILNPKQRAIIAEVAEIIIPRTDTPGAKDVGIPSFIESMLKDTFASEDQQHFISGLHDFDTQAQHEYGVSFLQLEPDRRVSFVQSIQDSVVAENRARQANAQAWKTAEKNALLPMTQLRAMKRELVKLLSHHEPAAPSRPFILTMKELTLLGFFTSQPGATQVLQYLPVPGSYQACIPVQEAGNGKTWAVETSYKF